MIWAIGIGMIVLSGLIHLPRWAIGAFGIGMIAGHNLLDGIDPAKLGQLGWLWDVLHQPGCCTRRRTWSWSPSIR